MLKAPKHSDYLLTFRILPSFHPTPKGVGFPARKYVRKTSDRHAGCFFIPRTYTALALKPCAVQTVNVLANYRPGTKQGCQRELIFREQDCVLR